MLRRFITAAILVVGAAFLPGLAHARTAYVIGRTALRAGPEYDYPIVGFIHDGSEIYIHGCLSDWSWCDISFGGDRGWIYGDYLMADYGGRRQSFIGIAPFLGIGFLSFSFGNYWDNYYRGRPFYSDRYRWERRYHDRYNPRWGYRPDHRGGGDRRGEPDRHRDGRVYPSEQRQHQQMDRNRQQAPQHQSRPAEQRQHQQTPQRQGGPSRQQDRHDRGDRGPR